VTSDQLSREQIADLASQFTVLLEKVDSGELVASTSTRYRLEGAEIALRAVLGEMENLRSRLFGDEP
jgi:hypothetical protein